MLDVIQLPFESVGGILDRCSQQLPRRPNRDSAQHPAVVVEALHAHHLEILGPVGRRRIGVGLVESVGHAHAFDRLLRDAVDHDGRRDAGDLEDRRHNVDHVVELLADAALVLDHLRPRDRHALARAAEIGRNLLGPFEWSIESPGPWQPP